MEISGYIVNYNDKGIDSKNKKIKHKYDNILIELDEKNNIEELIQNNFKVKTMEETQKRYITLNIVSASKIDKSKLNNEHEGTFQIENSKNGITWVKSAIIRSLF